MAAIDQHNLPPPRVTAVLVVHDGVEWLGSVLATLAAQRYPQLDLVAVDNASTDGSAEVLARRIPADKLLTQPHNTGFGAAVAAAADHPSVADAELLLLLHDDLALAPDAIGALVAALWADDRTGIVGPKLREWNDDGVLAEVGMTIDRFGRAVSGVEPAELDQGQHDTATAVLYVNTAGMLLRSGLLRELGGFDARFPAYRDDLDLCWRAWLAGHRVEVVPAAVGYHIGAGTRAGRRFGSGQDSGRRYLVERHAFASLLKNYGAARLARVLPMVLLLAFAKTIAFVLIRRFAEAGAVVRAYGWNVVALPGTLRRRQQVQRHRMVRDADVARLFAPGLPRARLYLSSLGAWLAGGSNRALPTDEPAVGVPHDSALVRTVADRPAVLMGAALLLAYLIGLLPLLGAGQVVGGEIAPWPPAAADFLRAYLRPFNGDPVGTYGFASPAQALLGVASFAGLGSAWLAQRLLVFGLLPLAWLLALRAGRLITPRAAPRTLGATLYVLSPVVLLALGEGRYGVLVAATLLPGMVLAGWRAADARAPVDGGWRAMALLALGLTVTVAAAPSLGPLLSLWLLTGLVCAAARRGPGAWAAAGRLLLAALVAAAILAPWLYNLAVHRSLAASGPPVGSVSLPMWRAATAVPAALPDLGGIAGVLAVTTSIAAASAAVVLGLRRRPGTVAALAAVATLSALAAWFAARLQLEWLWAPGMLLPAALALAGMGVLAAHSLGGGLREYSFGVRQVFAVVATLVIGAGLLAAIARLAGGPYDGLARGPQLIPAFVTADEERVGPYRVLVLATSGDAVSWDVVGPAGPTMLSFGTVPSAILLKNLDASVAGVVGGDPQAGDALGLAGIRYIIVSASSRTLTDTLAAQPSLEALPTGDGRVYAVRSWLPRAVAVAAADVPRVLAGHNLEAVQGLDPAGSDAYAGGPVPSGLLRLGEAGSPLWQAEVAGRALPRTDVPVVNAWETQAGARATIEAGGTTAHRLAAAAQLLAIAVIVSVVLRPPGFTQRQQPGHPRRSLPRELAGTVRQQQVTG
ncbi:MAG: glycosyltransferase family 2 protein [Actinomycetota bacterium]|nr:glycosyltransferase family 2 protein [Actinomycetota bacterium]